MIYENWVPFKQSLTSNQITGGRSKVMGAKLFWIRGVMIQKDFTKVIFDGLFSDKFLEIIANIYGYLYHCTSIYILQMFSNFVQDFSG